MQKITYIQEPIFPYRWLLDKGKGFPAKNIPYHKTTVFSCFSGGGGSSMGYKLAGYNVIGCNEIDKRQLDCYQVNLGKTPFQYMEDIRLLHKRKLPSELYGLDILDASPPCTTFSMAGDREKNWGKVKKFREGQAEQCLDDLVFEFLKLAEKLKPKIILIENVKGLLMGNAIQYAARIKSIIKQIGYISIHKVLNAADMGLPQLRERVFFIAIRKDLCKKISCYGLVEDIPRINLNFKCPHIPFSEIDEGKCKEGILNPDTKTYAMWIKTKPHNVRFNSGNDSFFSHKKLSMGMPSLTMTGCCMLYHPLYPRIISDKEKILISSFPIDYDFKEQQISYIAGMSVPPIMMANIAWQIKLQWLDIIKERNKK